ncbi:MAG: hypothetical protein KAH21_07285 [Spirochaetaceae bacterium]|nr:hypothetical protein [Spirochaetaceae bacterium]
MGAYVDALGNGDYTITIPEALSGDYELDYIKTGYSDSSQTITLAPETPLKVTELSMSKIVTFGILRFVVNWATDIDMDTYFKGSDDNSTYDGSSHIDYSGSSITNSKLDHDDTDGFGPETITLDTSNLNTAKTYVLMIDSQGRGPNGDIIHTQSVLKVYNETGLLTSVQIPSSGTGHVSKLIGLKWTGTYWGVTEINTIQADQTDLSFTANPIN